MFNLLLKIIKNEGFLKIQKMYKAYVKKACMFFILQSKLGYALHMQNTMTGRNIGPKVGVRYRFIKRIQLGNSTRSMSAWTVQRPVSY